MTLDGGDDEVVGMICVEPDSANNVLVLSENGYGKRTDVGAYRITNRGVKGVKTMNITDKTGKLVGILSVNDDNDLMIINKSGITLRMNVSAIRTMGRATQGVRLINLEKRNDTIASVCCVPTDPEEEVDNELIEQQADLITEAVDEMMNSEEPDNEVEEIDEIDEVDEIEESDEPSEE